MSSSTSPVLIFPFNKPLAEAQKIGVLNKVNDFLSQWTSHNSRLLAKAIMEENRLLIISIDPRLTTPSGCSKDKLVHFLQQLSEEEQLAFSPAHFFFLKVKGQLGTLTKKEIQALWQEDPNSSEYLLFPTWLSTEDELKKWWGKPLAEFAPILNLGAEKPIFNK